MNVLLTGAMGFIGSNLSIKLLNAGHKVLAFDNLSKPSIAPTDRIKKATDKNWWNFKFYKTDCLDFENMASIIAAHDKLDAVIHLAAVGSVPLSFVKPRKTMDNNVVGFTNIMELVRSFEIPKLIFASSSSVYGNSQQNPRKEGKEGFPMSPYALSKKANEELAILLCPRTTDFIGLRFFNVYGPGQGLFGHYSSVIPRFITDESPTVYGDGENKRDFTYVDDITESMMLALDVKNNSFIVNVGTGKATSLNELLDLLNKRDKASYKEQRQGDVQTSYADISGAKMELGFEAKTNIAAGLELTKAFYEDYKEHIVN